MQDIRGYEGLYAVTEDGRIWSYPSKTRSKGQFLSQNTHKNGYKAVSLSKDGVQTTYKVHRLIADAFIANPRKLPTVNHKDGDKTNNKYENLEWVTFRDNTKHAWKTGLCNTSNKSLKALELGRLVKRMLSYSDVVDIRFLYSQGVKVAHIAKEYSIARASIYSIVKYETYKEVA